MIRVEDKFYDWQNDEYLSSDSNVVRKPLTDEEKQASIARDLQDGYYYTPNGLLQKVVTLGNEPITYNPDELKTDDKGRKYFLNDEGNPLFVDDLGNIYGIFVDENGKVVEYITVGPGELLCFIDSEHRVGELNGSVYVYDNETESYILDPKVIPFPSNKNTR